MIKITGLDDLQRSLDELRRRAESIDGTHAVPITQLLTPEFMLLNTDFESVEAMFIASGHEIRTNEDFKAIPQEEWDFFIAARTQFGSWQDLLTAAGQEYFGRKLRGEA